MIALQYDSYILGRYSSIRTLLAQLTVQGKYVKMSFKMVKKWKILVEKTPYIYLLHWECVNKKNFKLWIKHKLPMSYIINGSVS